MGRKKKNRNKSFSKSPPINKPNSVIKVNSISVPNKVGNPSTKLNFMTLKELQKRREEEGTLEEKQKKPTDAGYMYTKAEDTGYMTTSEIKQGPNYMVADPSKSSYMTAYEAKNPTEAVYITAEAAKSPQTSHYVNISPYPKTTKKAYDFLTQKAKQGAVLSTRLARINPEYLSKLDKNKRLPYLYKLYAPTNAQIIDNMLKTEIDNLKTNNDKAQKLSNILTDFKNRALENNKKRTNIVENITLFMNKHTNPNVKQKVRTKNRSKTILENAIKKVKEQSIYSTLNPNASSISFNPFYTK